MNGPGKESMKRKYKIAMVQMDTQNNKEKNLEDACAWIDEAAASGAELVCFPEVMNLIGKNTGPGGGREPVPGFSTERLMEKAAEHGIYIHGGSITEEIPGEKRAGNTSVLIGPDGRILAKYQKLHTFDITLADGPAVPGIGPDPPWRHSGDGGNRAGVLRNVHLLRCAVSGAVPSAGHKRS